MGLALIFRDFNRVFFFLFQIIRLPGLASYNVRILLVDVVIFINRVLIFQPTVPPPGFWWTRRAPQGSIWEQS